MKRYIFALLFFIAAVLAAETIVPPGAVQGTWDAAGSPYRITGNLSIALGTSLLVTEGVEVIFNGTYRIDVAGRILATGTETLPVVFTAQDTLNGWSGIRFLNSGNIQNLPSGFTHTFFSYGKAIWGVGGTDPLNFGGAIWASAAGALSFTDCVFLRCKSAQDGSAIYAKDGTSVSMTRCTVKSCESGFFGGVFVKGGNANIIDCNFEANSAVTFAAAIYLYECPVANVISCRIVNNSAGAVTGIYSFDSPLRVINCLLANNATTMGLGGGIGAIFGSLVAINCTFANNSSAQGGAAIWLNSLYDPALISNSIFWNNTPNSIATTSSAYILSYCSTENQEGDATNIFGDPQFVNAATGDYRLSPTSACIDAGTPDITGLLLPPTDLAGLDRVADGDSDGIPRIDIGCYEWQEVVTNGTLLGNVTDQAGMPIQNASVTVNGTTLYTDQNGGFEIELMAGIYSVYISATGYANLVIDNVQIHAGQTTTITATLFIQSAADDAIAPAAVFLSAYPNPFAGRTELRWNIPNPVKLEVFNLRGQLLTSHLIGSSDVNTWSWDGRDGTGRILPSGIYLCRISGKDSTKTIKLLIRK